MEKMGGFRLKFPKKVISGWVLRPFLTGWKLKTENSKNFGLNTQKLREIKICNSPKLGTADQLPELETPHRLWLFCSKSVAIRVFGFSWLKTDKSVIFGLFYLFLTTKNEKNEFFFQHPPKRSSVRGIGSVWWIQSRFLVNAVYFDILGNEK